MIENINVARRGEIEDEGFGGVMPALLLRRRRRVGHLHLVFAHINVMSEQSPHL